MKRSEILGFLASKAPLHTAESWDNVGLLCGDGQKEVHGVLVTLDATMESIREAEERGCDLLVSHHPMIFQGMKRVTPDTPEGEKILAMAERGMGLISMHTNLDVAEEGVNDALAQALELTNLEVLEPTWWEQWQKLEVYVPASHAEVVRSALAEAGAGRLGAYDSCSFSLQGEGRFRPLEGARPFVGELGKPELVQEIKLEVSAPAAQMGRIIAAMRARHPYEEPAYSVTDTHAPRPALGLGRLGTLPWRMQWREFLEFVRVRLGAQGLRYVGEEGPVLRVAVGGGACGEFADLAFARGADAYVTADCKYHPMLTAWEKGQRLVDAGHFETEQMVCGRVANWLRQQWPDLKVEVTQRRHSVVQYWKQEG
ncbi:MAG: Nif3-like dinuclear metal center hexameric protein [Eubacteriales bacterium]|jgi:dinuclear metal center YbgI/SA1388 family protein